MPNKSAKDLAFDRERAKCQKQINNLKASLNQKEVELSEVNERASKAESKCEELQDWVDRLLEYMDIPEEDMKKLIQREKDTAGFDALLFGLSKSTCLFPSEY